jgi:DNA repair exonuclease SbcCD ATPase subunit
MRGKMERFRISRVSVDHFRGYREEKTFDLKENPDIVMISGPNGFGKTSFFDAIEWGFTGKLTRYNEGNEEKSNSRFINFQPEEKAAKVEIDLVSDKNKYVLVRESFGDDGKNTDYGDERTRFKIIMQNGETLVDDKAKKFLNEIMISDSWKGKLLFSEVFSQYHLLTQDKLKNFVQGLKATDRYKQISSLFGTDRFLRYSDEFKQIGKNIESSNNNLFTNLNTIDTQIKVLREYISNTNQVNLGLGINLNEYIEKLIKSYNDLIRKLDLDDFSYVSSSDKSDTIKSLMSELKKHKESVSRNLYEAEQNCEKLKKVDIKKEEYFRILSENDKLVKAIQNMELLIDIRFINENLHNYNEYLALKKTANESITSIKKEHEQRGIIRERLLELYKYYDNIYNAINNIINEPALDFSKIVDDINSLLNRFKDSCHNNDLEIELKTDNDKLNILLGDIIVESKRLNGLNEGLISRLFSKSISNLVLVIDEKKRLITDLRRQKVTEENTYKLLDEDIRKLSTLENDMKTILSEASSYIKKQKVNSDRKTNCPVCSTEFDIEILIHKIDSKLSEDNYIIKDKIQNKEKFEEALKKTNLNITDTYTEIKNSIIEFLKIVNFFRDCVTTLGLNIKNSMQEQELKINSHVNKIKELDDKFNKITDIIQKQNLNLANSSINDSIERYISYYENEIIKLGFSHESGALSSLTKKFDDNKIIIKLFLDSIIALEIKEQDIESQVKTKLESINNNIKFYNEIILNLKQLEDKVFEVENTKMYIQKNNELNLLLKKREDVDAMIKSNSNLLESLDFVSNSVKEAIENINQKIIDQSENFINAFFKRIYAHPNFRNLELVLNVNSHSNNILLLNCTNEESYAVNPAFTFSSAQINAIAISIFLSLAIEQKCTNLDDIFFDDPIQNMDDINVLAFIDIIRSIVWNNKFNRQIFVSTHDEQFFRLLIKKFRFINTKIFRFNQYNLNGPTFASMNTLNEHNDIIFTDKDLEKLVKSID